MDSGSHLKTKFTAGPYLCTQSLWFRIDDSVCFAQNSTDCAPYLTRQDANSEQLFISQKEGWSTRSTVPRPFVPAPGSHFFRGYSDSVIVGTSPQSMIEHTWVRNHDNVVNNICTTNPAPRGAKTSISLLVAGGEGVA